MIALAALCVLGWAFTLWLMRRELNGPLEAICAVAVTSLWWPVFLLIIWDRKWKERRT